MRRLPILIPQSGRVEARTRASNDAVVSSTLPIIPYGGFSPIRLEGWHLRRCLPRHRQLKTAPSIHRQIFGLRPPFVHFVATSLIPHCVGPSTRSRTVVEVGSSSAPGVLALA